MEELDDLKSHRHRWFTWIIYWGTRWAECRQFREIIWIIQLPSLKLSEPLRINWVFGCQNYLLELYVNLTRKKTTKGRSSIFQYDVKKTKLRYAGESDRTLPGCEPQVISWSNHAICSSLFSFSSFCRSFHQGQVFGEKWLLLYL